MKKLKFLILILALVPNFALAQTNTPPRRIIEEEGVDTKPQIVVHKDNDDNTVLYGLAAVVLAFVAIFAFTHLMNSQPKPKKKKYDPKF